MPNPRQQYSKVVEQLKQVPTRNKRLGTADFDQSGNTTGSLTEIASYQFDRPAVVRAGAPYQAAIVAYESFTTDGTASNTETFNLAHDIINSEATTPNLVLYEGGATASEDSINYSANSFDYTDDGTNNTLHAYYVVADPGHLVFRKVAPGGGVHEEIEETDTAITNVRDQAKSPLEFAFSRQLEPVFGKDWTLKVLIDSSFTVQWADDTDTAATADNLLLSVPIALSEQRIEGLGQVLRLDTSSE